MLRLTKIWTARNPYEAIGSWADAGVILRLGWYAVGSALSCCVLLLAPIAKNVISRLGENTIGAYIWHSFAIRLLAAAGIVDAIAQMNATGSFAIILPPVLALASAVVFSLKPPFGIIAGKILKIRF
jgi:fucose 4-O-acetylase-like acetyltransferase